MAAGHYQHQDWKLAVEEFQTFLAAYPNERRANECVFFLGEALRQLGKFDEARRQFQTIRNREPKGRARRGRAVRRGRSRLSGGRTSPRQSPIWHSFLREISRRSAKRFRLALPGRHRAVDRRRGRGGRLLSRRTASSFPTDACKTIAALGSAAPWRSRTRSEEAERLYAAVAGKPGSPLADAAQFHLGVVQYDSGKYDQALTSFSAFEGRLAKSPWRPNARLNCGLALLKLNRPNEAIKQFDAAMATPSADEEVVQQAVQGKIQAALADERLRRNRPRSGAVRETVSQQPAAPATCGECLPARSSSGKSRRGPSLCWRPWLARFPPAAVGSKTSKTAICWPSVTKGCSATKMPWRRCRRSSITPRGSLKSDAQLTCGTLLMALKRYAEAVAPLEAFLAEKPDGRRRGESAWPRWPSAMPAPNRSTRPRSVTPSLLEKYPRARFDRSHDGAACRGGLRRRRRGMGGGIVETAGRGRRVGRVRAAKASSTLGWSQFKAGKLAEAAATLDELLKKNPPEAIAAEAAFLRGRILQELGQNESALAMYNLVIERYPGSRHRCDALLAAARLQAKLKQPAAAAATYQRLAADYPRFPKLDAAVYEWAWLMQDLGKPEDAARLFERLHKEYPQSRFWADATCRLALQALAAKDYQRAGALVGRGHRQETRQRPIAAASRAAGREGPPVCHAPAGPDRRGQGRLAEGARSLRGVDQGISRAASGGWWRNTGSPSRTIGRATTPRRSRGSSSLPSGSRKSGNRGWRSSRCGTPSRWRSRTNGPTPRRSPPRSKRTSPISSSSTRSITCLGDVSPTRANSTPLGRHTKRRFVRRPARRPRPRPWPNG